MRGSTHNCRIGLRCLMAVMVLIVAGCPRSPATDIELTERLTALEDAMVQLDQENAELATRVTLLQSQLARQDSMLTRMGRMMDEMAFALERR